MSSRSKKIIFTVFLAAFLCFLFASVEVPDNSQFKKTLNSVSGNKVIIIFNSGGWGNTPIEEAKDFFFIVNGIQRTLNNLGYQSVIITYNRTKKSFLGRVEGLKEFSTLFKSQSSKLAEEIEYFRTHNPDSKVIVAGLSSGAAFIDKVMEKVSEKGIKNVFAIEAGIPFWEKSLKSENVLLLNNEGRDTFSRGEIKALLLTGVKAPFKFIIAKLSGEDLSLPFAFDAPGHEYFWDSPYTGPKITAFLKDKFSFRNF